MSVVKDNPLFASLSEDFIVRYVASIARILVREPLVSFDLDNVTQEQRDLLFTLCFDGIVNFEGQRGFDETGQAYIPRPTFQTDRRAGVSKIIVGETPLHSLIDDPILDRGIEQARGA